MNLAVLLAVFVLIALAVLMLFKTLHVRHEVIAELGQMRWIEEQYVRALKCLRSGNGTDILTGLQLISAFNDPDARLRVLPEVRNLIDNDDVQVARLARSVLDKIISNLSDEEGHSRSVPTQRAAVRPEGPPGGRRTE